MGIFPLADGSLALSIGISDITNDFRCDGNYNCNAFAIGSMDFTFDLLSVIKLIGLGGELERARDSIGK